MHLIFQALFQPRQAAESIKARPRWLAQYIVLASVSVIITVLMHPHIVHLTLYHLPSSATVQDKFIAEQSLNQELGIRCAFLPVRLLIGWVTFALMLFYACKAWAVREAVRFFDVFSLEVLAESVLVIAQAATLINVAVTGGATSFVKVPLGIDMFFSSLPDATVQMTLNSINVFGVWYIVLLTIGISSLYGLSKVKSCITVLAVWCLAVIFNIGVVSLLRDALSLKL